MNNTKKNHGTRSLTTILSIAFLALSVVVLLVSNGLQLYSNFQIQQATIYDKQKLIASDASKTVSNFIQDKFNQMQAAVDLTNLANNPTPKEKQTVLESLLGLQPAFRQLVLLDTDDHPIASTSRLAQTSSIQLVTRLTKDDLVQIGQGNKYISAVYIDESTSEPLAVMAIPVTNALGEFRGILAAEVGLKFMWSLVDHLQVGTGGYAYVVDEKGILIAYKDTARVLKGEDVSYIKEVEEFLNSKSGTESIEPDALTHKGLNGESVVTTFESLGTPQWAVIVALPVQEAYRDIIAQGLRSILIILGMAVLASLAGNYGARRLTTPLIELTNTANKIAGGELDLQTTASGSAEAVSLATAFNTMTTQLRTLIASLEQRISERTADADMARLLSERRSQELLSISEISRIISNEQKLDLLLSLITRLVSERFNFYHVGIFFIEETHTYVYLQSTNSEGGQRMLEKGHRLEVGHMGIVGNVAATGKARIALDVGADAIFFNNPELPDTRSEMALPLTTRGQIIGVLDVQSTQPGAFTDNDTNTLGILADQVAIAIQNARLFEETQQARDEAEALYNQYLKTDWANFSKQEAKIGYQQSMTGGRVLERPVENDEIRTALRKGSVVIVDGKNNTVQPSISIPVKLRGQTIGVLNVKTPTQHRKWNEDEVNLVQAISDRLALALDNARLLQESQRSATKEAKIGEVTAKIGASINMRNVLQTAVEELGRAMPGSEIVIQFQGDKDKDTGK